MKSWLRWLVLIFTCGISRHASLVLREMPDHTIYVECPRCHQGRYSRYDQPKGRDVYLNPPYWDVARGLYDRKNET